MMSYRLRNEERGRKSAQRNFRRYAAEMDRRSPEEPDREAERNELRAKVRYVVLHVLSAADRQVLTEFYFRYSTVAQIATKFQMTEVAVLQRLVRARKRFKEAFES
jgi:DNA-directed RNA polymerase specialized sigma subunit